MEEEAKGGGAEAGTRRLREEPKDMGNGNTEGTDVTDVTDVTERGVMQDGNIYWTLKNDSAV